MSELSLKAKKRLVELLFERLSSAECEHGFSPETDCTNDNCEDKADKILLQSLIGPFVPPITACPEPVKSQCRKCRGYFTSEETEYHDAWEVLCKPCWNKVMGLPAPQPAKSAEGESVKPEHCEHSDGFTYPCCIHCGKPKPIQPENEKLAPGWRCDKCGKEVRSWGDINLNALECNCGKDKGYWVTVKAGPAPEGKVP